MDDSQLLKPLPRRPNRPSPAFLDAEHPRDPALDSPLTDSSSPSSAGYFGSKSRSRSIINLTTGALFGIYAPQHMNEPPTDPSSPFGTGAETPSTPLTHSDSSISLHTGDEGSYKWEGPGEVAGSGYLEARRRPPTGLEISRRLKERQKLEYDNQVKGNGKVHAPKTKAKSRLWIRVFRSIFLFVVGVAYGALVAILPVHGDTEYLQVYCIKAIQEPQTLAYLLAWGAAGMILGTGLPIIDRLLLLLQPPSSTTSTATSSPHISKTTHNRKHRQSSETVPNQISPSNSPSLIEEFSPVVRSIGAFIGIAFAIRKLQWETTLQLSATLALTNPFLWYLLDRTAAGLTVASAVGGLGVAMVLILGNSVFPVPVDAMVSHSSENAQIGEIVWVASVLFWSCVCFGSVGRLLRR